MAREQHMGDFDDRLQETFAAARKLLNKHNPAAKHDLEGQAVTTASEIQRTTVMPKRKSSSAKSTVPSKKSKPHPQIPYEAEITKLRDLLADANALNESWRMRVMRLVEEKAEVESKVKDLEKVMQSLRPRTKASSKGQGEKEMAYIVYTIQEDPYEAQLPEFRGLYHDLKTANKAALIAYKNIPNVDWREYPITDYGTSVELTCYDIREDQAGRASSRTGRHQYKVSLPEGSARVVVEPRKFWSATTISRCKVRASDLPWKRSNHARPSRPSQNEGEDTDDEGSGDASETDLDLEEF